MLVLLLAILVIAWFGGLVTHVGGDFINLLLVVVIIVFIYRFAKGERL